MPSLIFHGFPSLLAKLTSRTQVTLPKALREMLGLSPGDQVAFTPAPGGKVLVERAAANLSFAALRGVLPRPAKAHSVEEMNEAVLESAAKRYRAHRKSNAAGKA